MKGKGVEMAKPQVPPDLQAMADVVNAARPMQPIRRLFVSEAIFDILTRDAVHSKLVDHRALPIVVDRCFEPQQWVEELSDGTYIPHGFKDARGAYSSQRS